MAASTCRSSSRSRWLATSSASSRRRGPSAPTPAPARANSDGRREKTEKSQRRAEKSSRQESRCESRRQKRAGEKSCWEKRAGEEKSSAEERERENWCEETCCQKRAGQERGSEAGDRGPGQLPLRTHRAAQGAPDRRPGPRSADRQGAGAAAVLAPCRRAGHRQADRVGGRQRGEQLRPRRRRDARRRDNRRRRPDPASLSAAGAGPRNPDQQADQPHRRGSEPGRGGLGMGQKIHPGGFRVGYIQDWKSNWFDEKGVAEGLEEELEIRAHTEGKLYHDGRSDITIERRGEVAVDIHTARPGIVIGKSGSEVDALRKELQKLSGKPVKVNIREVKRPELDAKLVAQSIAEQL